MSFKKIIHVVYLAGLRVGLVGFEVVKRFVLQSSVAL